MSFQARATIAPTLRQSQAGEQSTQPVRASGIEPVTDHRPTEPIGATTPGPSQSADGLQVVSRVKATRVPGRPPANEPAGASTSATASAERRTSGTPASAPARAGAEDLVSFPPQFPLDQRDGPLGKLGNMFAPRFADEHFERRYHQHRGQGLDSVLLVFWSVTAVFALCLWGYHATSKNGFDRPARIGISLVHGNLLIGLVFWAVLRFLPRTRAHSSALLGLMTCMLTMLYTWGLPATARETCQDVYNTFDSNLHQTVFTCLAFAAVFCRIGTGAFALVCLVTSANLCATAPASELQPLEPQTPHCTWHGPPSPATPAPRPQPRDGSRRPRTVPRTVPLAASQHHCSKLVERAGTAWLCRDIRAAQAPRDTVHHIRWGEAHGCVPPPRLRGARADAHGHRAAGAGDGGRLEGRRRNGARDGLGHIVATSSTFTATG